MIKNIQHKIFNINDEYQIYILNTNVEYWII